MLRLPMFRTLPLAWLIAWAIASAAASGATLQDNLTIMDAINSAGVASQKKIDTLARETQDLQTQYARLQNNTEYLQTYNAELQQLQGEQERQIGALQQQLADLKQQRARMAASITELVQDLETAMANDPPFHLEQRQAALASIKQQLARDDSSLATVYRDTWDTHETELGYARTIEAYRDTLSLQGTNRPVNVLRIGRLALYCQSLDGNTSAYWNAVNKQWEVLPAAANADIKQGLLIANKQLAAQPFTLPMSRRAVHE